MSALLRTRKNNLKRNWGIPPVRDKKISDRRNFLYKRRILQASFFFGEKQEKELYENNMKK
ncbi:hypothetical protein SAMN02745243_04074 [Hespellia stercorisuis DSM 15480]|uniref:Uncharacterized protein n=1 Tax=Hespellia stercorisuis DSM 15480 TaxID=1121950 RepID=A0A1M6WQP0_9FIRM|nr:hypothetical protein SAMN02745243_04074 [Hespellia stercorisuis DSM 15480]